MDGRSTLSRSSFGVRSKTGPEAVVSSSSIFSRSRVGRTNLFPSSFCAINQTIISNSFPFLTAGATGPGGPEFKDYKEKTEKDHGVVFLTKLDDLPKATKPRLALVSGRTADNPRLLSECIKVSERRQFPDFSFGFCCSYDAEMEK